MNLRQRQPRIENEPHRRFVAGLPCLICGATNVQAAHIKYADLTIGKPFTGGAMKADDCFVVPLCVGHHDHQHMFGNERDWWKLADIDPIKTALALFAVTGDEARGEMIVSACREQRAA